MPQVRVILQKAALPIVGALALAGLYWIGRVNYLLYHSLTELISVAVAFGIFMVAWNTRHLVHLGYVLVLGVAYFFVAAFHMLHMLAYAGMGVFAGMTGSNLAAQLWVAARFVESPSLLLALLISRRQIKARWLMAAYACVFCLLLVSIFVWRAFPVCFDETTGLTSFKKASEIVIMGILGAALLVLVKQHRQFDRWVLGCLSASILLGIASEGAFTAYRANVYGPFNELGHFLKLLSFFLIYKALIETGLRRPYAILFRDLKQSQEDLQKVTNELEDRVRRRTAELMKVNDDLGTEVTERRKAEQAVKAERQRLHDVLEMLPVYVVLLTPDYHVPFANRFFEERFGESHGRRCFEYLFGRNKPCETCETYKVLKTNAPLHWEWTGPDGRNYDIFDFPFTDTDGSPLIMEMGIDITERKRGEEALRQERGRLVSVLNMLPGYVSLVGRDHRVRFANHGFLDAFGEPADKPCYLIQMGRDSPCQGCPIEDVFRTRRSTTWEWTSPAGRIYRAWGHPFSDTDGSSVALILGLDVTEQKKLERQVIETGEAERRSIGRDLHDSLGQRLTGLALLAEGIAGAVEDSLPDRARLAQQMVALAKESIAEVRAMSKGLNPLGLGQGGLVASLAELAETVQAQSGIRCESHCDEGLAIEDTVLAMNLYRIAQEAVTNAAKHSRARHIWIRLAESPSSILLEVRDDGTGMPQRTDNGGLGMRTMSYRTSVMNGTFGVRPAPDKGTVLSCSVPKPGRTTREIAR